MFTLGSKRSSNVNMPVFLDRHQAPHSKHAIVRMNVGSINVWLRWWFYQHGLYCAKVCTLACCSVVPCWYYSFLFGLNDMSPAQNPGVAATCGLLIILLATLGLLNPRGRPFVFGNEVDPHHLSTGNPKESSARL